MATADEHEEKYLRNNLLNGLLTTPEWAVDVLQGHNIKTIADLIKLTEDQVREILQSILFSHRKVERAINAVVADLNWHNQQLAS